MVSLRVALAASCLVLLSAGESRRGWLGRRRSPAKVIRLGPLARIGCVLLSEEEADRLEEDGDGSRLADRIASRRTSSSVSSSRRSTLGGARQPADRDCPSGVTYFDGCNSCSCGTDQLCTLKACNADTMVQIFDPCYGITCGYHQRCQAICVGQVCQLRPLCVSDDFPSCHNCPWLCVDERIDCNDSFNAAGCKPTLSCYRPNV